MNKLHSSAKGLTGQRFGRLVAIEPTDERRNRIIIYCCHCDCGKQCFVRSVDLRNGHTKSCGCLSRELTKKRNTTHGMSEASIYKIWRGILARCENPNDPAYKNYGGRGIKVCERWHKFENFYADVGDPPQGMTLDRRNNDGNYEPENFRWATRKEQVLNSRPNSCGPCRQRWFKSYNEKTGKQHEDNNQHAFAKKYNLRQAGISACLNDNQKTHKGWTFQWLPA